MFKGQEITYNKFWNLIKENPEVKWTIIAYGGNYSFMQPSTINYVKAAEVSDEDENESCYKQIYFQRYEDNGKKFVEAGGFSLDGWPNTDYTIRIHNKFPLEILVDWCDPSEGFRDIIIFRDYEDKLKY